MSVQQWLCLIFKVNITVNSKNLSPFDALSDAKKKVAQGYFSFGSLTLITYRIPCSAKE